jgi:MFS family permease
MREAGEVQMPRARPRLFYGWWVVVTSALALFLGPTPIVVFSFGVFLKPLIQEFHSGRGAVSLAFTLHNAIVAFGLPFAGRLVDHFGARRVILPSMFAVGFILLSTYFCSGRIWELYLFYLALGVAGCGTTPVSYCDVISHWFDRYRGLALGFMMFGLGAGALIMPSVAQYLTARFGWRLALGIFGAAILVITAPVVTIFLKERPEPLGLLPDGTLHVVTASPRPDDDLGMSWGEAWRAPTFWLLFCAFILVSASVQGCLTHIAAILADRGTPARAAALATSLFGGGLLVGRTGSGYLLDRFFAPRVAALIFCCAAGGIALLRVTSSPELAFVAAFFIGLGLGAEVDIMAYLTTRYFGLRSFGAIYGFIFSGFVLAGGLGAFLMGAAFDATGSYARMLTLLCIVTLIGAALMMRLPPYRFRVTPAGESGTELETLPSDA